MVELKIKKDDEEITLMDKEDIENALDEKVDNSDLSDYYTKSQSNTEYSITVEKQSTADTGFLSTYVIKQNDIQKGVKINVPKDFLVKSTTVKTCNTANSPVSGYEVGDKYIDFVINSKDSTDTDEHLYLATKEIGAYPVDEVTLTVDNGKLAIKNNGVTWAKLATAVQNTINGKEDASNKVNSVSASSTITQYPSAKCVYDTFCLGNDPRLSDARTPTSHTHSVMDLNNYMPKSSNGGGTTGYLKVLNIKTNQAYLDDPITFEIYQRTIDKPIYCSLKFSGRNNTDPTVSSFKSWGSNNEVYIYKASTNNWQVIVKKIDYYDIITVENINCNWGRWNAWATTPSSIFTHLDETITSLPSNTSSNPLVKATYSISDVLTDTDTDRSLSANQGKVLKGLIDGHNHDSTYIKKDRYKGVTLESSGTNTAKPYYRLFHIESGNGASRSSRLIFEISSKTSTAYAKFAVYMRQNTSTSNSTIDFQCLEKVGFDLNTISVGFRNNYPNTSCDIYINVQSMVHYVIKIIDDQLREGTYIQYSPTEGNIEAYTSVSNAGTQLYGSAYTSITNPQWNIVATTIKKAGGTSSQFLKADGSVDDSAYLTHATKTEYIISSHTSSTSAWTGTSSTISSIERGTLIFYRLNQAPTTTNVTLNLTLKNGTTTGAKGVWIGGTKVTNQFPMGSVIMMVYDGTNWIVPNESPTTTPFTVTYTNGTTNTINFVTR